MARGDDFDVAGDLPDLDQGPWAYSNVYECPECYALVLDRNTQKHADWHKPQGGPVIVFDWENDDYATILCNGRRVGHYNHDAHGRDGLDGLLELAEGLAKALGGTFESEN